MAGPNDFGAIVTAILQYQTGTTTSAPIATGSTALPGVTTTSNPNGSNTALADTVIVAMLVGAGLESNWQNIPQIGGGPGRGYWQITNGPSDINAQVQIMYPRYEKAALGYIVFPEGSAKYANIAFSAERPAKMYDSTKASQVYQTVLQNYGGGTPSSTGQAQVVSTNPFTSFLQPVLSFLGDLTDIRLWRSLGWIILGIVIFFIGLLLWLRKPIERTVSTVVGAVKP